MKTLPHIIRLQGRAAITATITIYRASDATQPQHDELYRPDDQIWAVAEVPGDKRVWTVATDTISEAKRQLRAEVESKVREALGLPPINPYETMIAI